MGHGHQINPEKLKVEKLWNKKKKMLNRQSWIKRRYKDLPIGVGGVLCQIILSFGRDVNQGFMIELFTKKGKRVGVPKGYNLDKNNLNS